MMASPASPIGHRCFKLRRYSDAAIVKMQLVQGQSYERYRCWLTIHNTYLSLTKPKRNCDR